MAKIIDYFRALEDEEKSQHLRCREAHLEREITQLRDNIKSVGNGDIPLDVRLLGIAPLIIPLQVTLVYLSKLRHDIVYLGEYAYNVMKRIV